MKKLLNRENLIADFLSKNNINNYKIDKIAGDASFRSYYRITNGNNKNNSQILMDAPPEHEDITPFYNIDQILLKNGFSAPKIFAADYKNGFLLLEDFGNNSYSKVLARLNGKKLQKKEEEIYQLAIDLLINLHKAKAPNNLPIYDEELLMNEVMLFIDWYLPYIAKKPASKAQINQFKNSWKTIFSKMSKPSKLVLRDYHADNLMLLDKRTGYKKVGLLDFQDAVIGVEAYDIVSLLEDARRDVSQKTVEKMLSYYLSHSDIDKSQFLYDYEALSLQRNIKIIGIFCRLAIRDNKKRYLNLLPKVFSYVKLRLSNNNLNGADFLLSFL